jgi:hypothetical protein
LFPLISGPPKIAWHMNQRLRSGRGSVHALFKRQELANCFKLKLNEQIGEGVEATLPGVVRTCLSRHGTVHR